MRATVIAAMGCASILVAVWPMLMATRDAETEAEADELIARWFAEQPLERILNMRAQILSGFALLNAAAFFR